MIVREAAPGDIAAIVRLLGQAGLPASDLRGGSTVRFWVADHAGSVMGAVGLERHGDAALLRSLVVDPASRGTGVGLALVEAAESAARAGAVDELVLLTQTACDFFLHRGFSVIARDAAPPAVTGSAEFRALCPASAVCMAKPLGRKVEVLFLCTGNSCRSILAEATFNHLAPHGWHASSAGSHPTGRVHPRALALLAREGIDPGACYSKSWNDLAQVPDVVVTVCADAAGETCPAYLGPVLRAHWGVEDPARATGDDAAIDAAFDAAYRTLRRRIEAMFALPLPELRADRARLERELRHIGTSVH